ncbi:MAG: Abi family protein [Pseudomonadota bacterium]
MQKNTDYEKLEAFLSAKRLDSYLQKTHGNKEQATILYRDNLYQSKVFYAKLHWLEVGLRNAMNNTLSKQYGEQWFNNSALGLAANEQAKIQKAIEKLKKERKIFDNGNLIAELNLGLWVNLFNNQYDELFRKCLRKAFISPTGILQRKQLSKILHAILKLRNRIAHYEPIIDYDLPTLASDINKIIQLIAPESDFIE